MLLPSLQLCNRVFLRSALQDMLVVIAKNQDQTQLTAEHLETGLKLIIDCIERKTYYDDEAPAPKLVRPLADIE